MNIVQQLGIVGINVGLYKGPDEIRHVVDIANQRHRAKYRALRTAADNCHPTRERMILQLLLAVVYPINKLLIHCSTCPVAYAITF